MISHRRGLIALYSGTVLLAANGVFSKAIPLDSVSITFLRCVIAFFALSFMLKLQRTQGLFRLSEKNSYYVVAIVGALMAAHWSSFFHSMQISTVAIGILAHYSYPVITVLLAPLLDKQLPKLTDIMAGLVVLGGVSLIVPSWDMNSQTLAGVGFGLISATTWAVRNIIQGRWLAHESGQSIMAYQLLVIVAITALLVNSTAISELSSTDWGMLLALGIVGTALGHTLISISLRVIPAKSLSLISCLQPPIAIALSWLLLGEQPTIKTVLGGAIILSVAAYETLKAHRH